MTMDQRWSEKFYLVKNQQIVIFIIIAAAFLAKKLWKTHCVQPAHQQTAKIQY